MARYGNEHKEETGRRIIESAGRPLKWDGIDGSGIAAVMADAGLTKRRVDPRLDCPARQFQRVHGSPAECCRPHAPRARPRGVQVVGVDMG